MGSTGAQEHGGRTKACTRSTGAREHGGMVTKSTEYGHVHGQMTRGTGTGHAGWNGEHEKHGSTGTRGHGEARDTCTGHRLMVHGPWCTGRRERSTGKWHGAAGKLHEAHRARERHARRSRAQIALFTSTVDAVQILDCETPHLSHDILIVYSVPYSANVCCCCGFIRTLKTVSLEHAPGSSRGTTSDANGHSPTSTQSPSLLDTPKTERGRAGGRHTNATPFRFRSLYRFVVRYISQGAPTRRQIKQNQYSRENTPSCTVAACARRRAMPRHLNEWIFHVAIIFTKHILTTRMVITVSFSLFRQRSS